MKPLLPRVPGSVRRPLLVLIPALLALVSGCGGSAPTGTSDPPGKLRLERLLEFYRSHQDEKKKPPADEAAFKAYIQALPADRKQGFGMTENVDDLFTSPRDNQKYVIRYKFAFTASGDTEAVMWEATGANGSRFVGLTAGYVEEYDDAAFQEIKKK